MDTGPGIPSASVFYPLRRGSHWRVPAFSSLMHAGEWNRAWQYLRDLINYQSARSERTQLAETLCDLAQEAKASGAFQHQLELGELAFAESPDDVQAHTHRADALLCLRELDKAESAYRDASERFPHNVVARNGLAEVLKASGRLEEAEKEYRAATEGFPGAPKPNAESTRQSAQ